MVPLNGMFDISDRIGAEGAQARQNMLARQAGNAMAGGDYNGAANVFYKGGDLASGQKVQEYSDVQRKQHAEGAQRIAHGIRGLVASGVDPTTAYDHAMRLAPQLGIDPGDLQKLKPYYDKDPKAFLDFMDAQAKHQLEIVNRGEGGYDVVDKENGNIVRGVPRTAPPLKYKADENVLIGDGGGSPGAAPAANASPGSFDAQGFIKSFVIPHEGGLNKADMNGSPSKYGINQKANPGINVAQLTPDQAAGIYQQKYLPMSGATKLPPALAGVHLDTTIINPSRAQQFLQASGGDPAKYMDLREHWLSSLAKTPAGAKYAQAWSNRNADLRKFIAGNSGAAPATSSVPGYTLVHAAEADASAAVDQNVVKGLIEGRITPPTQKAAATPYWQAQLQAATAQDPSFDGVNFQARAKARADFTSGKSAQNITALNTVVGHLNTLDQAIDGLNNTGGFPGSKLNNEAAHFLARQSGTGQRLKNFEAARTAVANEMTRVFRGTGGAEADIQGYLKQLDSAQSAPELHQVVRQMAELMNSRLEALGEQYKQGMGTTKEPITLLTPDKQKAFQRMMGGQAQAQPQAPRPAVRARSARRSSATTPRATASNDPGAVRRWGDPPVPGRDRSRRGGPRHEGIRDAGLGAAQALARAGRDRRDGERQPGPRHRRRTGGRRQHGGQPAVRQDPAVRRGGRLQERAGPSTRAGERLQPGAPARGGPGSWDRHGGHGGDPGGRHGQCLRPGSPRHQRPARRDHGRADGGGLCGGRCGHARRTPQGGLAGFA
jgi:hypothetical protein